MAVERLFRQTIGRLIEVATTRPESTEDAIARVEKSRCFASEGRKVVRISDNPMFVRFMRDFSITLTLGEEEATVQPELSSRQIPAYDYDEMNRLVWASMTAAGFTGDEDSVDFDTITPLGKFNERVSKRKFTIFTAIPGNNPAPRSNL